MHPALRQASLIIRALIVSTRDGAHKSVDRFAREFSRESAIDIRNPRDLNVRECRGFEYRRVWPIFDVRAITMPLATNVVAECSALHSNRITQAAMKMPQVRLGSFSNH